MQNLNFKSVCKVLIALVCFVSLSVAWGEGETKRGFFDSFTNFFTPTGSIKGEGPVFDELKGVETQIDKIEVQYSRPELVRVSTSPRNWSGLYMLSRKSPGYWLSGQ